MSLNVATGLHILFMPIGRGTTGKRKEYSYME